MRGALRHMPCTLVVQDARVVISPRPAQRFLEGTSVGTLVSHGPPEHAGTVLVPDDTLAHAVQGGFDKRRIVGDPCILGAPLLLVGAERTVALIVRLVHHIEPVLVAELVELRCVRVMACPDRVDIVLFHQAQVPVHLFQADRKAGHRIAVMTVHAVELDLLSVEVKDTVPDSHLAQTQAVRDDFLLRLDDQGVEVRILRAPERYIVQCQGDTSARLRTGAAEYVVPVVLDGHMRGNAAA